MRRYELQRFADHVRDGEDADVEFHLNTVIPSTDLWAAMSRRLRSGVLRAATARTR